MNRNITLHSFLFSIVFWGMGELTQSLSCRLGSRGTGSGDLRSSCPCLLGAGFKGVCHHQLAPYHVLECRDIAPLRGGLICPILAWKSHVVSEKNTSVFVLFVYCFEINDSKIPYKRKPGKWRISLIR